MKLILLGLLLVSSPVRAELSETTKNQWKAFVSKLETQIESKLDSSPFLWAEQDQKRLARVMGGEIVVERAPAPDIKDSLVHHWIGAVFIPNVTLDQVKAVDQDYPRHKILYAPEVVESRIISHDGDHFRVFMRLRRHKVITAILDSEHDVEYRRLAPDRTFSRSVSRRISEVENAGKPDEKVLPPGQGIGFLWALNSYWRLKQVNGGVIAECDAVSLSRDLPLGTGTLLGPIVRSLGQEQLQKTLDAKRRAMSTTK